MEMKVQVYKDGQFRQLAGNKIYRNGNWETMAGEDQIYLHDKWFYLNHAAVYEQIYENGAEPSGKKLYFTPTGNGRKDGSSWENAGKIEEILVGANYNHNEVILYFSEGEYDFSFGVGLGAAKIYGGFDLTNLNWGCRNGFIHQTIFRNAKISTCHDGITFEDLDISSQFKNCIFRNITKNIDNDINFSNAHIIKGIASNCIAINCNISFINTRTNLNYDTDSICIFNCYEMNNCIAINCNVYGETKQPSASIVRIYNTDENEVNNFIAINCKVTTRFPNSYYNDSSLGTETFCYIIRGHAYNRHTTLKNISLINCTIHMEIPNNHRNYIYCNMIDAKKTINCIVVNCTSSDNALDTTDFSHYYKTGIFSADIINCSVINCNFKNIFTNTINGTIKNCFSWNCDFDYEFGDNSQIANQYDTNNLASSVIKFVNTGYYPNKGAQVVTNCPSPIENPRAYDAFLATFGDWHPQADSYLIGKGTTDSDATTDADGVTRPNPPTIGAYEPRPV